MKMHKTRFSTRVDQLQGSALREIFNAIDSQGIISFAGGLPAPESFPDLEYETGSLSKELLQYGASAGEWPLRELIAEQISASGLSVSAQQVLVLSGSQQGIDLVGKLFIDQGTEIAVESPTYLAALQVFSFFGASYSTFTPGRVEQLDVLSSPALLYINPTFQNPSSVVYTDQQRQSVAEFCDQRATVLFEDDPYRALAYDSCERKPVCAYLNGTSWIYQSSFSKTLCPGLRLGFLASSEDLCEPLLHLKQAADLHSNRLAQAWVTQALVGEGVATRLKNNVDLYRETRNHFHSCLQSEFAELADWSSPAGGLFFWLKLKPDVVVDMRSLLQSSLQAGVAFMPGDGFFIEKNPRSQYLRLNFSFVSKAQAAEGISRLAGIILSHAQSR